MDWRFVVRHVGTIGLAATMVYYVAAIAPSYLAEPARLFGDGRLYYRATAAWLAGGDPWAVSYDGITFAGIPPTLLLNLPFQPFGEDVAWAFWPIAGAAGMVLVLRRAGLPLWWLAWPPVLEGWLPGSPDMALAGAIALGAGAITAIAKPYAVPAMVGAGRWRALGIAVLLGLVTLPLLPWASFLEQWQTISATLASQALDLSAWGEPLFMVAAVLALVRLGRPWIGLATPALWPSSQLHYAVFTIDLAARSRLLAIGLALPFPGVAPLAVIVFALSGRRQTIDTIRIAPDVPGTMIRPVRSPSGA